MKIIALCVLVTAVFAIGCKNNQDKTDAKIASLESAINEQSNRLFILDSIVATQRKDLTSAFGTMGAQNSSIESMTEQLRIVFKQLGFQDAQSIDGVPVSVYAEIKADAKRQFPNDYTEQVYIIKEQVEAYKKLHP